MSLTLDLLLEARRRELAQAHFYRVVALDAERAGDAATAERVNELLADEQHHVSRVSARILELGGVPEGGLDEPPAVPELDGWEAEARRREDDEVSWYERALAQVEDAGTRSLLTGIVVSERHHRGALAGKWTSATTTTDEEDT